MYKKFFRIPAVSTAALIAAVSVSTVQAATVTFNYNQSFGAVSPDGPSPYATAVFDDAISPGAVTLTMTVAPSVNLADVTGMYFNLDPALDSNNLMFARTGGDGPTADDTTITTGTDHARAGGDGFYDILFDFPPPSGQQDRRFNAGETLVYDISGIVGLTALDFNFFGTHGPSADNPGPYLSVARFQDTGPDQNGSDFVGAVPVPAAVWLFGSGLLGLVGIARGRRV
jgi:hypothetical protein